MTYVRNDRVVAACLLLAGATFLLPGCGGSEAPIAEEEAAASLRKAPRGMASAVAASAHSIHTNDAGMQCTDCHTPHGMSFVSLFRFPPAAIIPNGPAPSLDTVTKTCSNVACHMVPVGTYAYWAMGGDGEAYLNEVTYGGPVTTPPWERRCAALAAPATAALRRRPWAPGTALRTAEEERVRSARSAIRA